MRIRWQGWECYNDPWYKSFCIWEYLTGLGMLQWPMVQNIQQTLVFSKHYLTIGSTWWQQMFKSDCLCKSLSSFIQSARPRVISCTTFSIESTLVFPMQHNGNENHLEPWPHHAILPSVSAAISTRISVHHSAFQAVSIASHSEAEKCSRDFSTTRRDWWGVKFQEVPLFSFCVQTFVNSYRCAMHSTLVASFSSNVRCLNGTFKADHLVLRTLSMSLSKIMSALAETGMRAILMSMPSDTIQCHVCRE